MQIYLRILVYRILIATFICFCCLPINNAQASEIDNEIMGQQVLVIPQAKATILIEAHTGEVLFAVDEDILLPPASTTKILTALLALDMQADMDKPRIISEEAASIGDKSIYLEEGESLSLADLLQGALVYSGNDACYAIGEIVAGNEKLFVHWMNMKAAVLGAYDINVENTNGLPSDNHLMSAAGLAQISANAMENDFFSKTVSSQYVDLSSGEKLRQFKNTNKLLWQDQNIVGIKTGTTDAAGPCLVAAYQDGAAQYISVVFNSPSRFEESISLLRYAADRYILISFPCAGETLVYLQNEGKGTKLIANDNLLILVEEKQINDLKFVWHLSDDGGTLGLQDGKGMDLGEIKLFNQN